MLRHPALWTCLCLSSLAGCATAGTTTTISAPENIAGLEWGRMAADTPLDVFVDRNGVLVKGTGIAPKGAPVKVGNVKIK